MTSSLDVAVTKAAYRQSATKTSGRVGATHGSFGCQGEIQRPTWLEHDRIAWVEGARRRGLCAVGAGCKQKQAKLTSNPQFPEARSLRWYRRGPQRYSVGALCLREYLDSGVRLWPERGATHASDGLSLPSRRFGQPEESHPVPRASSLFRRRRIPACKQPPLLAW